MPDIKQHKQYTAKVTVDDDERTVTAIISTGVIDRDKEVLVPKGMDFEAYLKNPVVQWAHDYSSPPIAKAQWLKKGTKYITAKVKFASAEQSPRADEIYQLFKGGFLSAFSVGFITKKHHAPTPDEIKANPELAEAWNIIDEWELLEFSAVPVPANPEALITAVKSKAVSVSKGLAEELGIEDEEEPLSFYTKKIEDELDETEEWIDEHLKIESAVQIEPVSVERVIEAAPYRHTIEGRINNMTDLAVEGIKTAKGIM